MYHISKDKRSARSADLIYTGLRQCLEKKAFDQITVTDVQRASGVARTTIYRCFDNLSDVLYWRCDRCFREALQSVTSESPNEPELMQRYFSYWMEHSDILKLLMDIGRPDIIYACHMKEAEALARSYGILPGLDEIDARYFMAIRTGVTIGVLKAWLDEGRKETSEELMLIIERQISNLKMEFARKAQACNAK